MGFMDRLRGKIEDDNPVRVAVIGRGDEAARVARAYRDCPRTELVAFDGPEACTDIIRTPGLEAAEILIAPGRRAELATQCIQAGLMTSVDPILDHAALKELYDLSLSYRTPLRIRMPHFYYPPYLEFRRLIKERAVGAPLILKLATKRGRGAQMEGMDAGQWIRERELGFLALATWFLGDVEKVHARLGADKGEFPASSVISFKYGARHMFGYFQLDFCPELHIRSAVEPVHRNIELTADGGLIIASRGEGQMLRVPALVVRGKSTTTAFEMVPDDWSHSYGNMALETFRVLRKNKKVTAKANDLAQALRLLDAALESSDKGVETRPA